MSNTHTTSGGGFYETAVLLRGMAREARSSYPATLARMEDRDGANVIEGDAAAIHAPMLMLQAVGFEIAAAILCVAQAIEDANHGAQPRQAP